MSRLLPNGLRAAFWVSCLLTALVSLRFIVLPLAEGMYHMLHYQRSAPVALYLHLIGAPLALILAPFQLWQGLRRRLPNLHRALGYGYATSVLVASVAVILFLPSYLGNSASALGFAVMAMLWLGFTARGVWLARAGDFPAHRRFMLRSIAMTFAAVTLRLMMAPLMAKGWSVVETYQITAWASWIPNLILVELWLRSEKKRTLMREPL